MYYMEFLGVRKTLYWLTGLLATGVAIVSWVLINNNMHRPPVHHHAIVPLVALMAGATFVSAIVAMIFACALARQNRGHLPLVWTRPISREKFALTMTLVHIGGIAGAFILTMAAIFAVLAMFGSLDAVTNAGELPVTPGVALHMFLFPMAWYGLVMALTASTRGGAGFMAFGAWIVGSLLVGLDQSQYLSGASALIVNIIDHINPLYYFSTHFDSTGHNDSIVKNASVATAGLAAIAVAGYAAALAQWRRLEA